MPIAATPSYPIGFFDIPPGSRILNTFYHPQYGWLLGDDVTMPGRWMLWGTGKVGAPVWMTEIQGFGLGSPLETTEFFSIYTPQHSNYRVAVVGNLFHSPNTGTFVGVNARDPSSKMPPLPTQAEVQAALQAALQGLPLVGK